MGWSSKIEFQPVDDGTAGAIPLKFYEGDPRTTFKPNTEWDGDDPEHIIVPYWLGSIRYTYSRLVNDYTARPDFQPAIRFLFPVQGHYVSETQPVLRNDGIMSMEFRVAGYVYECCS